MVKYPVKEVKNTYNKIHKSNETIICFAYEEDLEQIYDFYCARYENISWEEFLDLGMTELRRKLKSIPEKEPLYTIIKSRTINLAKIKDKEERKYWRELKDINKIPDIYKTNDELNSVIKNKLGGLNGNKFTNV